VIRRNEIAVPVVGESSEVEARLGNQALTDPWEMSNPGDEEPSGVEE